jgi:hypothetical protein
MEELLSELVQVAQSIARVEVEVAAVEAGVAEAKASGDREALATLLAKEDKLRAKENLLREKENKLRDEKSVLREEQNTLLLHRGESAGCAWTAQRVRVALPSSPVAERRFNTPAEFRALLESGGISPDDHVLDTISRSVQLSTLMVSCFTLEQAIHLLELAGTVLHSTTKALVQSAAGVVVDGMMPIEGVQSAMFFYAFKDCVPHVLKVLTGSPQKAKAECQLWRELRTAGGALDGVFCVPVTLIELRGTHTVTLAGGGGSPTHLRAGILMPRYACTLSNIPKPMDATWALRVLTRMSTSLHAVHAAGWVHGDVKPSNVFIDFAGDAWLGDYGSSCRTSGVALYTGGTPAFQCAEITVEEVARFDRACLAVSICSAMGAPQPELAAQRGWPMDILLASVAGLADAPLRAAVEQLLLASG